MKIFAQLNNNVSFSDTSNVIIISSYSNFSSNNLPLSFATKFLTSDFLNYNYKTNVYDKLKENNLYDFGFRNMASFYCKTTENGSNKIRLYFKYTNNMYNFAEFSKDAFEFIMFGNYQKIGEKFVFDNTKFSFYSFNKLQFGVLNNFGKNAQHIISISPFISIHNSSMFVDIKDFYFSTSLDTSNIEFSGNGNIGLSDKTNDLIRSIGGGVDVFYSNYNFIKNYNAIVGIDNLGVFNFIGKQYSFASDSAISFSGFSIDDFSDIDSVKNISNDSLDIDFLIIEEDIIFAKMLPASIYFNLINIGNNNFKIHASMIFFIVNPKFFNINLFPTYSFKKFDIGIPIGYSGYRGQNIGVFAKYTKKNIGIELQVVSSFNASNNFLLSGVFAKTQVYYKF